MAAASPALARSWGRSMRALTSTASPCALPHHAPTIARPISVIASRTTPSVLRPACTISGVATANPLRTRLASSPTVKPCARRIGSVHPFGDPASIFSALICSPVRPLDVVAVCRPMPADKARRPAPEKTLGALFSLPGVRPASLWRDPGAVYSASVIPASGPVPAAGAPTITTTVPNSSASARQASGHRSALTIVSWWHCQHDTASDRTPLARMLPRVMGGPG
jgi:hypothetical protein